MVPGCSSHGPRGPYIPLHHATRPQRLIAPSLRDVCITEQPCSGRIPANSRCSPDPCRAPEQPRQLREPLKVLHISVNCPMDGASTSRVVYPPGNTEPCPNPVDGYSDSFTAQERPSSHAMTRTVPVIDQPAVARGYQGAPETTPKHWAASRSTPPIGSWQGHQGPSIHPDVVRLQSELAEANRTLSSLRVRTLCSASEPLRLLPYFSQPCPVATST